MALPGKYQYCVMRLKSKSTNPSGTTVVQQHGKSISLLLDFFAKSQAASFVLEICDNVITLSRSELIESGSSLFELALLPACNDNIGSVLDEGLSSHFA